MLEVNKPLKCFYFILFNVCETFDYLVFCVISWDFVKCLMDSFIQKWIKITVVLTCLFIYVFICALIYQFINLLLIYLIDRYICLFVSTAFIVRTVQAKINK